MWTHDRHLNIGIAQTSISHLVQTSHYSLAGKERRLYSVSATVPRWHQGWWRMVQKILQSKSIRVDQRKVATAWIKECARTSCQKHLWTIQEGSHGQHQANGATECARINCTDWLKIQLHSQRSYWSTVQTPIRTIYLFRNTAYSEGTSNTINNKGVQFAFDQSSWS